MNHWKVTVAFLNPKPLLVQANKPEGVRNTDLICFGSQQDLPVSFLETKHIDKIRCADMVYIILSKGYASGLKLCFPYDDRTKPRAFISCIIFHSFFLHSHSQAKHRKSLDQCSQLSTLLHSQQQWHIFLVFCFLIIVHTAAHGCHDPVALPHWEETSCCYYGWHGHKLTSQSCVHFLWFVDRI